MYRLRCAGALSGAIVATTALTIALSAAVDGAFSLFGDYPWLAGAFPFAGAATWGIYRALRVPFLWGSKHVIGNVAVEGEVSARVVPAIFAGTCLTILVGGSVGKEAAALQMGAGLSASLSRMLGIGEHGGRLVCACSLACALSVLLGAPIAGALFAVEAMGYRTRRLADYGAIALSACAAKVAAWGLSLDRLAADPATPAASVEAFGWVVLLVAVCSAASVAFCCALAGLRGIASRPRVQVPALIVGGVAASVFLLAFGGGTFAGTGMEQAARALTGSVTGPYFLVKALFTLVLLGVGFKGGEIMPTLCIGATLGCAFGAACGIDPAFMAAIGLVAYFSACTNCPLATFALACEAFGVGGAAWFALAAIAPYPATRRFGFYENPGFYHDVLKDARACLAR